MDGHDHAFLGFAILSKEKAKSDITCPLDFEKAYFNWPKEALGEIP